MRNQPSIENSPQQLNDQPPTEDSPQQRFGRWTPLLILLAVTCLVRVAAVVALRDHLDADPDAYANLAVGLHDHGVLGFINNGDPVRPTALRPPLYPMLLAPFVSQGDVSRWGVAALHVTMGVLTVLLVERLGWYWLGWHWLGWHRLDRHRLDRHRLSRHRLDGARPASGTGKSPLIAAGAVAFDPLLLNQSALVMTETLAVLLAAAGLLALTRLQHVASLPRAVLAGVVLGFAILCRPTFAPWAAASCLLCLMLPIARGRRLMMVGACAMAAGLMLAPWTARNYQHLGKPIPATTHGGYTLLLANNPHFYDYLDGGQATGPWDARELKDGFRGAAHSRAKFTDDVPREIQYDQLDYHLAWQSIRSQPGMFVRASLAKAWRLWTPLPRPRTANESPARSAIRYLTGGWYLAWYALALAGLISLGRSALRLPWVWGLAMCLTFTLMHAVYWSDFRMRAPLLPVIYLLAAVGGSAIAARRRQGGRPTAQDAA